MKLFQAGGALLPGSKPFEAAIYAPSKSTRAVSSQLARQFRPQVIGSPLLSGKTTQVHTICKYHERMSGGHVVPILCRLPKQSREIPETDLREILATNLLAKTSGSLADILSSSAIFKKPAAPRVLAIINSEALSHAALRWLLTGFRAAHERPALTTRLKVQLLIDGSFGVETLTAGPDSDYPLPQSFPREFSEKEQHSFFASRLTALGFRISDVVRRELWQHTAGDKYLTQVVGQWLTVDVGRRSKRTNMSATEIRRILEEPKSWSELYAAATRAVARLVTLVDNDDFRFRRLLTDLESRWTTLAPAAKSIAYEGGLVRRVSETDVAPRAPFLKPVFDDAIARAYETLGFLRLGFSPAGVDPQDRARALQTLRRIVEAATTSRLVTVHVGYGTVAHAGAIRMSAVALDGSKYRGDWSVPAAHYAKGEKVWGLLWATDDASTASRSTHAEIYRMTAAPERR